MKIEKIDFPGKEEKVADLANRLGCSGEDIALAFKRWGHGMSKVSKSLSEADLLEKEISLISSLEDVKDMVDLEAYLDRKYGGGGFPKNSSRISKNISGEEIVLDERPNPITKNERSYEGDNIGSSGGR